MSLTINGTTNTLTAASGLTIAGNTAVTGTLTVDNGLSGLIIGPAGEMLIGEDSTALYIGTGIGGLPAIPIRIGSTATTTQTFRAGGGDKVVISGSAVTLSSGVNLVMASGQGIDFSATSNGSGTTTSEVLSDYEEGTWTPAIYGTSTAGTGTYSLQSGTYTKVGRQVTVTANLTWSAHTGTGNMRISGLPFTNSARDFGVAVGLCESIALTAGYFVSGYVLSSEANIGLVQTPVGGGSAAGIPMDTSAGPLFVTATYFV